ncbi:MAG: hypothetical protein JW982_13380 [Spirochaetes bacterium]|nr:hypothetical protein [Spirochaetota bacterium]
MKYPRINVKSMQKTGEIIDNSFKIMKHGLKTLFISFAVMIFPFSSVFYFLYSNFMGKFTGNMEASEFEQPEFWINFGLVFLLVMIMMLVIFNVIELIPVNYILLYERTDDYTTITPVSLIKLTLKRILKMIWGNFLKNFLFFVFLSVIIFFVVIIGIIIALALSFSFESAFSGHPLLAALMAILIFFAVIAIYIFLFLLYAPLMLFPIIYFREERGVISSILRCFELVKGEWWKTFGLMVLMYLIISSIASILYIPLYSVIVTSLIQQKTVEYASVSYIVSSIIGSISFFIYFIGSFSMSLKYYHLVEKNEGASLDERLSALPVQENPA